MEVSNQTKVDILGQMFTELSEIVIGYLVEDDRSHLFLSECCLVSKSWHHRISFSRVWFNMGKKFGLKVNVSQNDSQSQEQISHQSPKFQFQQLKRYGKTIEESPLDMISLTEWKEKYVADYSLCFDTMDYDSEFIVLAGLQTALDIHLFCPKTKTQTRLNPNYPADHWLACIIAKEGHLGVFSVGNGDMRLVIYTLGMEKVTEIHVHPVEFTFNRNEFTPGPSQIFDFSVKHDIIATACSSNAEYPQPQVAIYRLSDGEKIFTIPDVNPDETFGTLQLAFDPTEKNAALFVIWVANFNHVINLRKLSLPELSLIASETITGSALFVEEELAVAGGLINIFGECFCEQSDLPPSLNITDDEALVMGLNHAELCPGGCIYQLCFDTCEERKSKCITSTVQYLYNDFGQWGGRSLRLIGFGTKFALYGHTKSLPQCDLHKNTYRIVQMPDMNGEKIQCPRHIGTMERIDSETLREVLGETKWLDGINSSNDPEILLLRLSNPNSWESLEYAHIRVNTLKPVEAEYSWV